MFFYSWPCMRCGVVVCDSVPRISNRLPLRMFFYTKCWKYKWLYYPQSQKPQILFITLKEEKVIPHQLFLLNLDNSFSTMLKFSQIHNIAMGSKLNQMIEVFHLSSLQTREKFKLLQEDICKENRKATCIQWADPDENMDTD